MGDTGTGPRLFSDQPAHVLVVDDERPIRALLRTLLGAQGHRVSEAVDGRQGLEALVADPPDIVLLDLQMPDMSGLDVLRAIRADAKTRLLPVVMLTGAGTPAEKLRAIGEGVTDFVAKPFHAEELTTRVRALVALKRFTDALEDAEGVIVALARTIDARDPYTARHSSRVSLYAGLLGERVGLKGPELHAVRHGGLFHDIGKIAIRDAVLLKPGKLTPEEMAEIRRHPAEGKRLIEGMRSLRHALDVVLCHHERRDGSGYPTGLEGDAIPLTARITTVADIFDALTTARVYRGALPRDEALGIMAAEAAKGWWDARLLDEFRGVLETLRPDDPRIEAPDRT